jgi:hypothetical protein
MNISTICRVTGLSRAQVREALELKIAVSDPPASITWLGGDGLAARPAKYKSVAQSLGRGDQVFAIADHCSGGEGGDPEGDVIRIPPLSKGAPSSVTRPLTSYFPATFGAMNAALIRYEGHRNSMSQQELVERMRNWLAGEYQSFVINEDSKPIG